MITKRSRAARCALWIGLAAGVFTVGSCGFQPIYGTGPALNNDGEVVDVAAEMTRIGVVVGAAEDEDGRGSGLVGFETRNQLLDLLGGQTGNTSPYVLTVELRGARRGLAVQSDASITRFNYFLRARYSLIERASGETLLSGSSQAYSAYNVVDSEYATVTARRDAEFRAARNIAQDVKLQLALFFKSDRSWRGSEKREAADAVDVEQNVPSYKKGSPRVPDDRPVGTPAPAESETEAAAPSE